MTTYVLIDCNGMCYRVLHTMSDLSYHEKKTGVIFGFLKYLLMWSSKFDTNKFVFCWDSRKSYRKDIYPDYKKREVDKSDDEAVELRRIGYPQFNILRREVLPQIGFRNVWIKTGFEADDLLHAASINIGVLMDTEVIMVTSDNDMLQSLSDERNVKLFNPATKKVMTELDFYKEWGIPAVHWPQVKALAGCKTDNVPGLNGIGEKTATKYWNNQLSKTTKAYRLIMSEEGKHIYERNMKLVKLPFNHGKRYIGVLGLGLMDNFKKESLSFQNFIDICNKYGFKSFLKSDELKKWRIKLNLQ